MSTNQPPPGAGFVAQDEGFQGSNNGDWCIKWWSWALSSPSATNPVVDATGNFWYVNQNDPALWYLAGTFGGPIITRKVTIPLGNKGAILIPVYMCICTEAEGLGSNWAALSACAKADVDAAFDSTGKLVLDINAKSARANLIRVQTPLFNMDIQSGNPLGIAPGTTKAVSDNVFVIMKGLTSGTRLDIHVEGKSLVFSNEFNYNLTLS
jgi:hypothetical protein